MLGELAPDELLAGQVSVVVSTRVTKKSWPDCDWLAALPAVELWPDCDELPALPATELCPGCDPAFAPELLAVWSLLLP